METIFYYVKTGKILSKDEVSALMSGHSLKQLEKFAQQFGY